MLRLPNNLVNLSRRLWTASLALPLLAACNVGPSEILVQEDSFQVSGRPRLEVDISNGKITVLLSDEFQSIMITATIRNPGGVYYLAGQDGDTVAVVADVQKRIAIFRRPGGVDVQALVPRNTEVQLKTSNGRIAVEGIVGSLIAESSNGRINLSDVHGDAEVKTSNGSIEITGFSGQVKARTSNGGISVTGKLDPGSQNSLTTSNGNVEVTLVDTDGTELDAATNNGRISSELPITTTGSLGEDRLVGTIGAGGSSLKIETSNGSITIR